MPARVETDRRLAGPVCEGSTCPDKSYELPLRLAEVPRFSWKERLEWSQPERTPPMAASSVDRYSPSLGGSSCPVGDSIPRLVG